jgi:3-deoxy-D-manno-octulosonic-acid transferase
MLVFYNLLVFLSAPLIFAYLLIFLLRRKDFRPNFWERLGKVGNREQTSFLGQLPSMAAHPRSGVAPRFWIHAVSVGEVMAAVPLVKGLRMRFPDCHIAVSVYTPTGRDTAQRRCPEVERIFYFPLDIPPIVQRVVTKIHPDIFVLLETDIWPVLLRTLARKSIPSLVVNGRISPRRLFLRPFYRRVLGQVAFFCMQTGVDAERLLVLGTDARKIAVTGNMKFAQAIARDGDPLRLREALGLPQESRLLIAGSTHDGEEEEILRCYRSLCRSHQDILLMIAPRHPERADEIESLCRSRGFSCARRSRAEKSSGNSILLLDTIGELSDAYALGTFIFIGGSLVDRGGHNVLEPASWGKPIFFGPHMENYSDIASILEKEGAGVRVRNGDELAAQIDGLIRDNGRLLTMGERASSFVNQNQGAVEKNLDHIERILAEVRRPTAAVTRQGTEAAEV